MSRMSTTDLLKGARHTFSSNRVRVMLTLLGIVIGSGAMVLLAGLLTAGEEALVNLSQQANESDMIEVHRNDPPLEQRKKPTKPLSRYDAEALDDTPLLDGAVVTPAARRYMRARYDGKEKPVSIFSAEHDSLSLYRLALESGRYFATDDAQQRRRVCVIGQEVWTELLARRDVSAGDVTLTLDGNVFTVVGVLAHKPTMGRGSGTWMWDRRVLMPSSTYATLYEPDRAVRSIFVRMKGVREAAAVKARMAKLADVVEQTLLRRHNQVKNFEIESDARGQNQETLILRIIEILLFGTGVLALFVGGINVMNIMLVTVTERTKEIGVRRALGATPGDIVRQFLLEAVALSGAGGLIGVVCGVGVTWLSAQALTALLGQWRFAVEPWSLALALGMAALVGIVFGLVPALRAARLDVVDALRSE